MAIGNMHKTFREARTCSSEDMLADRQTHTHTDRHNHHNTGLHYLGRSNNRLIKTDASRFRCKRRQTFGGKVVHHSPRS